MKKRKFFFLTITVLLASGCSSVQSVYQVPDTGFQRDATYALVANADDRKDLAPSIVQSFENHGITVATISSDEDGAGADYLVHYSALWIWDVTWFLGSLIVSVHDGENGLMIAAAHSTRSSPRRRTHQNVVSETVDTLLEELDDSP